MNKINQEPRHQPFTGSLGEFAERYINGEKFYQFDAGHAYELSDSIKAVDLKHRYGCGVFELVESAWYENIGDGVLCWVQYEYGEEFATVPSIIDAYYEDATYKYSNAKAAFFFAKPLTKEEAMRFVWGE